MSTAVPPSVVARVVGIEAIFKDLRAGNTLFLPQRAAIFGQGATASTYLTTKRQITSATEAGTLYGFGSPIHLAALQLLPINGDGIGSIPLTIYPLEDDGSVLVYNFGTTTVQRFSADGTFDSTVVAVPAMAGPK